MGHTNKAQRDKYERNTITLISKYGIKMKIALRHVSYTNITIKPSYCFAMIILSKKKKKRQKGKKKKIPTDVTRSMTSSRVQYVRAFELEK